MTGREAIMTCSVEKALKVPKVLKPLISLLAFLLLLSVPLLSLLSISFPAYADPSSGPGSSPLSSGSHPASSLTKLHILSTSDIHCRYHPYDYTKDKPDKIGSMSRLSTIVRQIRSSNDNSILIDVGDSIQGSLSQAYLSTEKHPFATAANYMDYDVWVLGNHEFNFGIDNLRSVMNQMNARILCGNVYNPDGSPFAPSYTILNKGGIRIGVIGMVTPSVTVFASDSLDGCTVTNPLQETKKLIHKLRPRCDVLIAAEHMGLDEEYGVYGSGAEDLAKACPEIDVILAAHAHKKVAGKLVNGVLITENKKQGKTLSDITLTLDRHSDGTYKVIDKISASIDACDYDPDPDFMKVMNDTQTLSDAEHRKVIGVLTGLPLTPKPISPSETLYRASQRRDAILLSSKNSDPYPEHAEASIETSTPAKTLSHNTEIITYRHDLPQAARGESTLVDLINEVQLSYTGADISSTFLPADNAGHSGGQIRTRDLKNLYPDDYTIFKLKLSGKQLRQYMEWSASYYEAIEESPSETPDNSTHFLTGPAYGKEREDCDIFSGVNYEIDLSKPAGQRICYLSLPDGSPINDSDTFSLVTNRVRAAQLVEGDTIFPEGQPHAEIIQGDVHDEYSGLREMIGDFIQKGCGGKLNTSAPSGNWKLTVHHSETV